MTILPLLLALTLPAPQAGRETFAAKVVAIHDGDTISVLRGGHERLRLRLAGIDCPELHQDFGRRAKQLTGRLAFGRAATIVVVDRDRYDRLVTRVEVDGEDLGLALVRAGLAWFDAKHSDDPRLAEAERQARAARLGLWSQRSPVPPWEWRARHPRAHP
jgi:endonuclease YncB( thermonuclease family)